MLEFDSQSTQAGSDAITSSPSSIPLLDHHPPLPILEAAHAMTKSWDGFPSGNLQVWVSDFECRVELPYFRTLTGNGKSVHRQAKTRKTIYRSSLNSPDSCGVGDQHFFVCLFGRQLF